MRLEKKLLTSFWPMWSSPIVLEWEGTSGMEVKKQQHYSCKQLLLSVSNESSWIKLQCSCNCICGPLLQLCCLHAEKLKKNVIGAACVKHGNTCISSIFSLFCGGRQLSQGLFGGRGCANLIASLTVKLFDVIALLQIELSHYNYLL